MKRFRLARMSPLILTLTLIMLALPLALLVGSFLGTYLLFVPTLFVVSLYAWVWLRFRPSRFIVHQEVLEVIWPLKRREVPREDILNARLIDAQDLQAEIGTGMRVGAGGLWGGFGWLWTKRRGIVQMYISRTDRFVWIDCAAGRPWLITPEQPEAFVHALTDHSL